MTDTTAKMPERIWAEPPFLSSGTGRYDIDRFESRTEYVLASTHTRAMEALAEAETLEAYLERQIEWSRRTFGPALRTKGVLDHIRKECSEVEANPHDLSEWVDLIILAVDGFWRHGGGPGDLMPALLAKQRKNMARSWPDWRTMSEDKAIEHDRSKDATLIATAKGEQP
jgi:hypothetical protein